jgi:hypothetical protein
MVMPVPPVDLPAPRSIMPAPPEAIDLPVIGKKSKNKQPIPERIELSK